MTREQLEHLRRLCLRHGLCQPCRRWAGADGWFAAVWFDTNPQDRFQTDRYAPALRFMRQLYREKQRGDEERERLADMIADEIPFTDEEVKRLCQPVIRGGTEGVWDRRAQRERDEPPPGPLVTSHFSDDDLQGWGIRLAYESGR